MHTCICEHTHPPPIPIPYSPQAPQSSPYRHTSKQALPTSYHISLSSIPILYHIMYPYTLSLSSIPIIYPYPLSLSSIPTIYLYHIIFCLPAASPSPLLTQRLPACLLAMPAGHLGQGRCRSGAKNYSLRTT